MPVHGASARPQGACRCMEFSLIPQCCTREVVSMRNNPLPPAGGQGLQSLQDVAVCWHLLLYAQQLGLAILIHDVQL